MLPGDFERTRLEADALRYLLGMVDGFRDKGTLQITALSHRFTVTFSPAPVAGQDARTYTATAAILSHALNACQIKLEADDFDTPIPPEEFRDA